MQINLNFDNSVRKTHNSDVEVAKMNTIIDDFMYRPSLKYGEVFYFNDTEREDKSMIARLVLQLNDTSLAFVIILFSDKR